MHVYNGLLSNPSITSIIFYLFFNLNHVVFSLMYFLKYFLKFLYLVYQFVPLMLIKKKIVPFD